MFQNFINKGSQSYFSEDPVSGSLMGAMMTNSTFGDIFNKEKPDFEACQQDMHKPCQEKEFAFAELSEDAYFISPFTGIQDNDFQ